MQSAACPICSRADFDCTIVLPLARAFLHEESVTSADVIIATTRHVDDWWSTTSAERLELLSIADTVRQSSSALSLDSTQAWELRVVMPVCAERTARHAYLLLSSPTNRGLRDEPRTPVVPVDQMLNDVTALHDRALIRGAGAIVGQVDDPLLPHLLAELTTAVDVSIAVAFTLSSGVAEIEEHLRDVLDRGGRVRLLTGDYLGVTEPDALLRLLDLGPELDLRVFESNGTSFHLKTYVCLRATGHGVAFVGSSNLSRTALRKGVEWNWRVVTSTDGPGFADVRVAFDALINDERCVRVDPTWVSEYRKRRPTRAVAEFAVPAEAPLPVPEAHSVQREALAKLAEARASGSTAGLVVLATGLGKTWLAAFDTRQAGTGRVLFIAHREEILDQAMRTFRVIRPDAALGKYTGTEKTGDADIVFASVQTLARGSHLSRFEADAFSYIVVDEFHHAAASTYRRILDHFEPDFLLGLTATPERSDGADLLALCGENLIYRCDLTEGIRRGLLAPFDYFGVPDEVDYENIPWRNGKFDEEELTNRLAVDARASNALEQLRVRGGERALAFCVSKRHADFMSAFFAAAGVRCVAVHSGPSSAPRAESVRMLKDGEIDVLFAVDIFNEGVDLPDVDTVLMLRPTESAILFLQQLGRGLRFQPGKRLKVVDYIGNHRSFLTKPKTLFQITETGYQSLSAALQHSDGDLAAQYLAPGCSVTYDLVARRFMQELLAGRVVTSNRLEAYYKDFRDRLGSRPSASETFHDGYDPKSSREGYGSWFQFVHAMEDLSAGQVAAERECRELLSSLETAPMRSATRLLLIRAMIAERQFPGAVPMSAVLERMRSSIRRSAQLREEFDLSIADDAALTALCVSAAKDWTIGLDERQILVVDAGVLSTTSAMNARGDEVAELIGELVDWRLTQYLARADRMSSADRIVCRVSHSGGSPILFLPARGTTQGVPEGWVEVVANGNPFQAKFAKIAVNVMHEPGSDTNVLGDVLRGWYGSDAGQAGTSFSAVFERSASGYKLSPLSAALPQLTAPALWSDYSRQDCASLLGVTMRGREAQSGVVIRPGLILLFVTLDKVAQPSQHQYLDEFLTSESFQWQSQNRTTRDSTAGQLLTQVGTAPSEVHLFVRPAAKVRGKTEKFTYCGLLRFDRWDGDKPITVWWKLTTRVPSALHRRLRVRSKETLA